MASQENQAHFFDRLYSELAYSSVAPTAEEILNASGATHLVFTNLASGETLNGFFYLQKNFLVHYTMEIPEIILDLSYARPHTILIHTEKSALPMIHLYKNQDKYEIVFDNRNSYDDWMLKLRKFSILTNFEKKYQIADVIEKKGDISVKSHLKGFLL